MRNSRAASVLVLLAAGCSGKGNMGQRPPAADLVQAVPWTNGAVPPRNDSGVAVLPDEPVYPPIELNTPDPGSGVIDCGGLAGIELAAWVETFELSPTDLVPGPTW